MNRKFNKKRHNFPNNGGRLGFDVDDVVDRRKDQGRPRNDSRENFEIRRVKFKHTDFKNSNPRRGNGRWVLDRLSDDVDMSSLSMSDRLAIQESSKSNDRGRRKPGGGGGGGGRGHGNDSIIIRRNSGHALLAKSAWFRVNVVRGAKYDKMQLLKLLQSYIQPQPLMPYCFRKAVANQNISFFVGDFQTATMLQQASGRITFVDGQKIIVNVFESKPDVSLQPADQEKIKSVLAKRYNPAMKALDLSKLYDDMNLKAEEIFVPLSVPSVLLSVIKIVDETIPDLYALDMSDNKVFQFPILGDELKNLKILHLTNNKFSHFNNLQHLRDLEIEELVMKDNPVCSKIRDQAFYVKEARRLFPKLLRLDGVELPPVISFDTGTPAKLLPAQASFLCSPQGQEVIKPFVQQYFEIFDSDNRTPLMGAYHDNAQFSLSCSLPYPSKHEKNLLFSHGNPEDYTLISRNLCKIKQPHLRKQRLYVGKDNVINCLCSLPKSQHDPSSFTVDLTIFTPQLLMVSLNGVFRERPVQSVPIIRSFSRTFTIVPVGAGFCVINELLFIGIPSIEQAKAAFKSFPLPGPSSPVASTSAAGSPVVSPVGSPQALDITVKQQMVTTLANFSGMNLMWAEKCLVETNWNYDLGLQAFNELKTRGVIPPEAFIK